MITGLRQKPVTDCSIPSLIRNWNAGYVAYRTTLMYAVESAMDRRDLMDIARSQVPLVKLIHKEFDTFTSEGWSAIPGINGGSLSELDRARLSSFKHNSMSSEQFFPASLELAAEDPDFFEDWYQESQSVYRRRPPLGPMIRGLFHSLRPSAAMERVELMSGLKSDRIFRDDCFDSARIAFANLISNAIKFNKPDGQVVVSNEGLKLFFQDTGRGMHPSFAARLLDATGPLREEDRVGHIPGTGHGWVTIRETARNLGWLIVPNSTIGEGSSIEVTLNEGNFYQPGKVITSRFAIVDGSELIGAADVLEGAKVYSGMQPFEGYRITSSGHLDISRSAIYRATEHAGKLVDLLYKVRQSSAPGSRYAAQPCGTHVDGR